MAGITLQLPVAHDPDQAGGLALIQTYRELVKQNFKNLLLTIPGEAVQPDFGVGIQKKLFEPESDVYGVEVDIKEQAILHMSYIKVLQVRIATQDNSAYIQVRYKILPLDEYDELNISVTDN